MLAASSLSSKEKLPLRQLETLSKPHVDKPACPLVINRCAASRTTTHNMLTTLAQAAERPTLINTRDPRPDILPRPFYDNHSEYRAQYNRPRFLTGWLAYEVSRTSQEAMVWKENYCAGNYDQHHMPPVYKTYYYPKPWEALDVGARPGFATAVPKTQRVPALTESRGD